MFFGQLVIGNKQLVIGIGIEQIGGRHITHRKLITGQNKVYVERMTNIDTFTKRMCITG